MDHAEKHFLWLGKRWLELTKGQKKYVVVATIILLAIIDSGVYAFSLFVPADPHFMAFEQLLIVQIAMTAFGFLTIGLAAIAARRNG